MLILCVFSSVSLFTFDQNHPTQNNLCPPTITLGLLYHSFKRHIYPATITLTEQPYDYIGRSSLRIDVKRLRCTEEKILDHSYGRVENPDACCGYFSVRFCSLFAQILPSAFYAELPHDFIELLRPFTPGGILTLPR